METRTKKVQGKYKVSGAVGQRKTQIIPALELSGNWLESAGFAPGQQVSIVTENGLIYIRPC